MFEILTYKSMMISTFPNPLQKTALGSVRARSCWQGVMHNFREWVINLAMAATFIFISMCCCLSNRWWQLYNCTQSKCLCISCMSGYQKKGRDRSCGYPNDGIWLWKKQCKWCTQQCVMRFAHFYHKELGWMTSICIVDHHYWLFSCSALHHFLHDYYHVWIFYFYSLQWTWIKRLKVGHCQVARATKLSYS